MLSCSESIKHEYCCTVVKIGECFPIKGADKIQRTLVNGMDMVISKQIKKGDIMIYAANETQLYQEFLSINNQFGISDYVLNANRQEVDALLADNKRDEAKTLCGFFTSQCRVKMLKLKGIYSFGFLFGPEMLIKCFPQCANLNFEAFIDKDFDTVDGTLFVKAYVPKVKEVRHSGTGKPVEKGKFNRIIDENFNFHYDSQQLQRNITKIKPDDVVTVSVKVHGTSAIYGKIECRIPKKLPFSKQIWNNIVNILGLNPSKKYTDFTIGQDNVYASRNVIKNKIVDRKKPINTTTTDIWGHYNNLLAAYIPENTTVYGEIIGYMPDSDKFVQKNYDYGYAEGESRFMPYRTSTKEGSKSFEWKVEEVKDWTMKMLKLHPELKSVLIPIHILYHGTLKDLYPEIPVNEHWHENVLAAMKADKKHFGMEQDEPLCKNKVPREGICIRIDEGSCLQNFKLKCSKFLSKESKDIDAGEIDVEMQENNF